MGSNPCLITRQHCACFRSRWPDPSDFYESGLHFSGPSLYLKGHNVGETCLHLVPQCPSLWQISSPFHFLFSWFQNKTKCSLMWKSKTRLLQWGFTGIVDNLDCSGSRDFHKDCGSSSCWRGDLELREQWCVFTIKSIKTTELWLRVQDKQQTALCKHFCTRIHSWWGSTFLWTKGQHLLASHWNCLPKL